MTPRESLGEPAGTEPIAALPADSAITPRPDPTPGHLISHPIEVELSEKAKADCRKIKCVALTFDDGPSDYTEGLLDTLDRYDAKATFFVLGPSAAAYPSTIARMAETGHELGNHTWSHPQLPFLSDAQITQEFDRTDALIERSPGSAPP